MSQQIPAEKPVPQVLIVGAGIGGLILAILFEQINIPYRIFERASDVKPLGAAMSFAGSIFPALEQLGIYEELVQVSKINDEVQFYDINCENIGSYNLKRSIAGTGYHTLIFSRPRFYEILRKRVPAHKISFQKKVLSSEEKGGKVHIHCSDNTSYAGDILIGADGAYSGVRQSLYKQLDAKGILPKEDLEDFSIGYAMIVGVANLPNPEKYPQLKEENSGFSQVLYEDGSNCYVVTLPDNQISWGFGLQLPQEDLKAENFRNSEWSPETNDVSLKKYRDLKCPLGGTMGEIFDATPNHLISKVFLEEKLFTTWHHGRTVLLGDACHKLHPAGGQGAQQAIQDAIVLVNSLYNMTDCSPESIKSAFEEYYSQRYPRAERGFNTSVLFSKIMNGH
ncbi:hypothetical protein BGX26_006628, partial [Mortierella sp. AD094]